VSQSVVEFRGVSKSYSIYETPGDRLKELLTLQRRSFHRDYWALSDVSFRIPRGETFCVIGENGAGKSTLLQLIAGIMQPTSGTVTVNGRVSALLELGAGFNPEFTGRDNVYLNGSILGFSTADMQQRFSAIEEFAEIGDFIDQPVKTYSSGMIVRLAFAVAIHVDPDVLLVDEALAVGDIYFRQRCMRKVHQLRENGTTILFVTHSMPEVKNLGDRTLWLEHGHLKAIGDTGTVVSKFQAAMAEKDTRYLQSKRPEPAKHAEIGPPPEVISTIPNVDHRHGDKRAEVIGIAVLDQQGKPLLEMEPGSSIIIRISVRARQPVAKPNIGFMIRNHLGVDFAGTNTSRDGYELPPMAPGAVYTTDFHLVLPILYPGHFSFSPSIADGSLNEYSVCDWIDNAVTLQMNQGDGPVYGFMHIPARIELNKRLDDTLARSEAPLG
jgi:homopolymeric O-antigen transport system ATP-binding protein